MERKVDPQQLENGQASPSIAEKALEPEPPAERMDGGRQAWLTLIGGWLTCFVVLGHITAFGVYQDTYTRAHAASPSAISWIGSTQFFFLAALAIFAGKALDSGHFRITVLFGSVTFIFALFMLSLAHTEHYYQLYLTQGLLAGIGGGFLYLPAVAIQAHHWRERRALAMGVAITGSSVGGIVYPIMLNQLINEMDVGFAWGVRAVAFLSLGLLVVANLLMTPSQAASQRSAQAQKASPKVILSDLSYDLAVFGVLLLNFGYLFPYFYLQLFSILHGVDPTLAFYTIAILNGSSILGRTVPNMLADKFGVFNSLVSTCAIMSVLIFAMFGVASTASTIVFAVLYGITSGAFLSLLAPLAASFARHPSEVGVRMGIAYSLTSVGSLVGTPITGALLTGEFHWYRAIIFSGVICTAGTVFLAIARALMVRRKGTQRV